MDKILTDLFLSKIDESEAYYKIKTEIENPPNIVITGIFAEELQVMLFKLSKGDISLEDAIAEVNYIR